MRLFVEVSSPGVEHQLRRLGDILAEIRQDLKFEPPDFSTEDAQVKAMSERVEEAKDRLPKN